MTDRHAHPAPSAGPQGPRVRKRTLAVSLVLLGAVGVGYAVYRDTHATDPTRAGAAFDSVSACEGSHLAPLGVCATVYADALRRHQREAPFYATSAACGVDYADCTSAPADRGAGSIPAMVAFVIARTASGGWQSAALMRRRGATDYVISAAFAQPLPTAAASSGGSRTTYVGSGGGRWGGAVNGAGARSAVAAVSRGGFGASARGGSSS